MKKIYSTPKLEVTTFESSDIITMSGDTAQTPEKFGTITVRNF